jgi:pimeloyl-ACP methyl ester carboxylesterase
MEDDTGWFKEADMCVRSLLGALVLLGGLAGGLVHSDLAAADPVPLWSYPITTSDWAAYGAGGREVMYVNSLQMGMLETERVIGPDGAVEYEAETGNTTIAPPALAADGSGYVLRGGGAAGVIDAIDTTGKVRWSYAAPAEDTVRALLAGNDGAAYVIVSNAIDEEVLRLSAVDGSVTFDTPLPDGNYSDGYLFAEPSGVAAITGTHVLFLSQEGQVTADAQAFPSGSATVFTSNTTGDVFVGTAPAGSEVNLTNGLSVSKIDPSGQVDWTTQTPATGEESGDMALAALPDGGVAYEVAGQSVGVLNADGTTRWNTKNPLGYGAMLADSADHIDFERVVSNQSCSDAVANCDGFAVDQVEASDGQVQRSVSLVSSEDPSRFWFCGGFSLGPGLFYVLDRLAPADGETCSGGVTQPQLQAFALAGTTGPYPSPPATTIPPVTGPTGGGGLGGGGGPGSGATHSLPIVMIPGIQSETARTTPATPWTRETQCPTKEPFAAMCATLRAEGYPVYVVDASVGASPKITLDSEGDIKTNATKLIGFLNKYVHGRALLVGHSMGGLIARVAMQKYQAAGLFTIGTPYEGSYVADVGETLNDVICLALQASPALNAAKLSCSTIEAALHKWIAFGSPAARELTHAEREKEAATLSPPSVPLWTIAGTGVPVPQLLSGYPSADLGYFFPNDILVGENSAWGLNAHLGATCAGSTLGIERGCDHRIAVPAFHFGSVFGLTVLSPAETSDPTIIADVQDVAQGLENQGVVMAATIASTQDHATLSNLNTVPPVASTAFSASHRARRQSSAKPRTQRIALVAIGGSTTSTSQTVQVASQGFVVSDRAFQVSCDGRTWEAVAIAPGVWAAFGATVTCPAVAHLAAGSAYLTAVKRPRMPIRATGTTRGSLLTVRIVSPGTPTATLSLAGRRPLHLARRRGGYEVTAHVRRSGSAIVTIISGRDVLRGVLHL